MRRICVVGDSITDSSGSPTLNPGPAWSYWPEVLLHKLERIWGDVRLFNNAQSGCRTDDGGLSGGTSTGMLNRFQPSFIGAPDIVIIEGSANDIKSVTQLTSTGTTGTVNIPAHGLCLTGQSVLGEIFGATPAGYNIADVVFSYVDANNLSYTVPAGLGSPATGTIRLRMQTKRNIRALIKWAKFGCIGSYRSQADLPSDGVDGDRYVVLSDTSTTGGIAAVASDQQPTITGSADSSDPTVWELRRTCSGETGWGRVANASTKYFSGANRPQVFVLGYHYLNYSANGDTQSTPYALYDDVSGLRKQQIDAAAAEGATYIDLYAFLKSRIAGGLDTQGSYGWHVADGDHHFNVYGHSLVSECVYQAIQNS